MKTANQRRSEGGYVTHDQINSLMKEVNAEQIENVVAMFSEMGINIVEEAETEEGSEGAREAPEEEESSSRSRAPRRARPRSPNPGRAGGPP
jgi:RNA polymerase primary sigma factor